MDHECSSGAIYGVLKDVVPHSRVRVVALKGVAVSVISGDRAFCLIDPLHTVIKMEGPKL